MHFYQHYHFCPTSSTFNGDIWAAMFSFHFYFAFCIFSVFFLVNCSNWLCLHSELSVCLCVAILEYSWHCHRIYCHSELSRCDRFSHTQTGNDRRYWHPIRKKNTFEKENSLTLFVLVHTPESRCWVLLLPIRQWRSQLEFIFHLRVER